MNNLPRVSAPGYGLLEMIATPWGKSSTLRQRRLPPGPGTPRAEVERNQRNRLFGAMVAVASEKGYAQTSVADLVEVSGVSSRSFYDLFDDKEACFLATLDEIITPARAVTASKMRQEGSWEVRARTAIETFMRLVVEQPAAARLCLVEAYAAGPAAVSRIDEALEDFEELMQQAFEEQPERSGMPVEMTRAMVGGIRKMIHTRLHRGVESEILELLPELLDLELSYRPPPQPLRGGARRRRPGLQANGEAQAVGSPGDRSTPKRWREEDPAERIICGTMVAMAAKGYQAATVSDIAEAAGASPNTFYAHFDSKDDAFDAAIYSGWARMMGELLPVYNRARSWPEGIRAVIEAMFAHLEEEPDFARLIAVEVYAAGATALERRDRGVETAQRIIDDGVPDYAPQMKPIVRETIVSYLYAMLCDQVRATRGPGLRQTAPLAVYMALAPFLGPEEACEVANGRPRPERG